MPPRIVAFVWDGYVLHIADRGRLERHVHSAVQLTLGADEPVAVQDADGQWVRDTCVVVGSNAPHALRANRHAILWLEPHGDAGRRLTAAYARDRPVAAVPLPDAADLGARAMRLLADPSDCDAAWRWTADWVEAATGHLPRGAVVHPAIRRALRFIARRPRHKVGAEELAAEIGLSVSRTTHLFREHVGMPLRRYLMWQRVQAAAVRLADGMPASEVAHEVGFADAAHLTRTLKRMLALRPSDLQEAGPVLHVCHRPPPAPTDGR